MPRFTIRCTDLTSHAAISIYGTYEEKMGVTVPAVTRHPLHPINHEATIHSLVKGTIRTPTLFFADQERGRHCARDTYGTFLFEDVMGTTISRTTPFDKEVALDLVEQVRLLHTTGIIHGAISFENIRVVGKITYLLNFHHAFDRAGNLLLPCCIPEDFEEANTFLIDSDRLVELLISWRYNLMHGEAMLALHNGDYDLHTGMTLDEVKEWIEKQ